MAKAENPLGELALIEMIRSQVADKKPVGIRVGIGDDCAVLRPPAGTEVVVTTDFCLEGRHFKREWHGPESIGHRCLARGLSDLAAMGAEPLAAFLSLALPAEVAKDRRWIRGFLSGFQSLADRAGVTLAGGDTAESPSEMVLADIVLLGTVRRDRVLLRSGAKAGDSIYITGGLGGAAAELRDLAEDPARFKRTRAGAGHPHLYPEPRLNVGKELVRRRLASACLDISDGLSTDLAHLCKESGVSAEVEAALIPLHPLCTDLEMALHGGEDYELLFTAPKGSKMPGSIAGVKLTRIGTIFPMQASAPPMTLLTSDGQRTELKARGFEHFRQRKVPARQRKVLARERKVLER